MKPIRMAVIGYGLGGRAFHAPFIHAVEGLELAAIVSSRKDEIAADYPDVTVHSDPQTVFDDPSIEAVAISTPNDSHASLAIRALEAGKHVVIDKPFAQTAAEALAVMAKAKGRLLSVFHNRRWDGDFLTLKRLIAEDRLGRVAYFESHFDLYRPVVSQRWREQPGPSSGAWYDLGSHLIDQALQLFGLPDRLYADIGAQRDGGMTADYFRVHLQYPTLRVVLAGNYQARSDLRFVVHGTKTSYIKHGLDPQQAQITGKMSIYDAQFGVDAHPGWLILPGGEEILPNAVKGDYSAFYKGFRDAMRGLTPVAVTAKEALQVMQILSLAEASAQNHCEIDVDVMHTHRP